MTKVVSRFTNRFTNYVQPATVDREVNKATLPNGVYSLMKRVFLIIHQDSSLNEVAETTCAFTTLEKGINFD
jgi:hypothetical protein